MQTTSSPPIAQRFRLQRHSCPPLLKSLLLYTVATSWRQRQGVKQNMSTSHWLVPSVRCRSATAPFPLGLCDSWHADQPAKTNSKFSANSNFHTGPNACCGALQDEHRQRKPCLLSVSTKRNNIQRWDCRRDTKVSFLRGRHMTGTCSCDQYQRNNCGTHSKHERDSNSVSCFDISVGGFRCNKRVGSPGVRLRYVF